MRYAVPLVVCFLLSCGCGGDDGAPEPTAGGHPASHWIERLDSEDPAIRLEASERIAEAIGKLGPAAEEAESALDEMPKDDVPFVRTRVEKALARIRDR